MTSRIGIGYDVHRLVEGIPFRLGGLTIPFHKGAEGHSDADTLIHALCDALLGAVASGDIGLHFPDTSVEFKGIDSAILLKKTYQLILPKGYRIINIDAVVMLQEPKIRPYIEEMRSNIAAVLGMDFDDVSIKATTTEKLGFIGMGEGVAAEVVVLLQGN